MRLYFSMNMTENKKTNGFAPCFLKKSYLYRPKG
nr:MAG TPA: hypothetical protein [Caudoviricetes sp.]